MEKIDLNLRKQSERKERQKWLQTITRMQCFLFGNLGFFITFDKNDILFRPSQENPKLSQQIFNVSKPSLRNLTDRSVSGVFPYSNPQ